MASRRTDTDEEDPLVDVESAAAASLFSPNLWIHRPTGRTGDEGGRRHQPEGPSRSLAGGRAASASTRGHEVRGMQAQHPSGQADCELSYLEADDAVCSQREQAEQDSAHIAALEAELRHAAQLQLALQARQAAAAEAAAEAAAQSATVKRLLAALQVRREDLLVDPFSLPAEEAQRHMAGIGHRLLANLQGSSGRAAAAAQLAASAAAGPAGQTPAAAGIPVYRGAVTTPRDYPAESQIAAAALALADGDPAEAVLALLAKALGARAPAADAGGAATWPAAAAAGTVLAK